MNRILQRAAVRIRSTPLLLQRQHPQPQVSLNTQSFVPSTTKVAFSTEASGDGTNTPATTTTSPPPPPTAPGGNLLDAFRDPLSREERMKNPPGRSWHARELRRKSFDDLHKLWHVLYKERNMLLTEQQLSRRHTLIFPHPTRLRKVQKSMGAIKQVLGERKREKISQVALRQMEGQDLDMDDLEEDDMEGVESRETVQATKEKV